MTHQTDKQYRMADVFDEEITDQDGMFFGPQPNTNYYKIFMPRINAACHAVNTYDAMQDRIEALESTIRELDHFNSGMRSDLHRVEQERDQLQEALDAEMALKATAREQRDRMCAQNIELNKAVHECLVLPGSRQDEVWFILGRVAKKPSKICLSNIQAKAIEDAHIDLQREFFHGNGHGATAFLIRRVESIRQQADIST